MTVPETYGGAGQDEVGHVLTLMEISRVSASVGGFLVSNNALFCFPLLEYGTEQQKKRYLPLCASGKEAGSFALAGNANPAALCLIPDPDGQGKVVTGERIFFPAGFRFGIAPSLSQDGKAEGSAILDLKKTAGLSRKGTLERDGIFFSGIEEMFFDHVRVRDEDMLAAGDRGESQARALLQEAWMALAALAAGIGKGSLQEVMALAERSRASGSLSQVVEWTLADSATDLEVAELFVLKAAWLKDHGKSYEKEAAAAKVFATEAAVTASCRGLQILGTEPINRRPSLEKRLREAAMCQAYYGTTEQATSVVADHSMGHGIARF